MVHNFTGARVEPVGDVARGSTPDVGNTYYRDVRVTFADSMKRDFKLGLLNEQAWVDANPGGQPAPAGTVTALDGTLLSYAETGAWRIGGSSRPFAMTDSGSSQVRQPDELLVRLRKLLTAPETTVSGYWGDNGGLGVVVRPSGAYCFFPSITTGPHSVRRAHRLRWYPSRRPRARYRPGRCVLGRMCPPYRP